MVVVTCTLTVWGRFYCIWDSFRAQHPLLTILDPVAQDADGAVAGRYLQVCR